MAARQCSSCGTNWPLAYHGACRSCGDSTSYVADAEAIDATEAHRLKCTADFERWLEAETAQARTSRRARHAREQKAQAEQLAVLEQQLEHTSPPER